MNKDDMRYEYEEAEKQAKKEIIERWKKTFERIQK